jgi:hypothetical protein
VVFLKCIICLMKIPTAWRILLKETSLYSVYEVLHVILMIASYADEACSWECTCTNVSLVRLWSESFQSCTRTWAQEEGELCCLSTWCNELKTRLTVVFTCLFPTLNFEWYHFHNLGFCHSMNKISNLLGAEDWRFVLCFTSIKILYWNKST